MIRSILMLGAGQEQCIAIQEAQALGYRVVACDAREDAPGLRLAEQGHVVELQDVQALIALGRREAVSGVFCHAVEIPEVVAQIAQALDLPGLNLEVAHRCTNKHARIKALRQAGIPVAEFVSIDSAEALVDAAQQLGYPLVLKPVDNAGSRGVRRVDCEQELLAAYEEAMQHSRTQEVLLEQFLQGPQISTESVVYQGQIHTFAFADRNYAREEFYAPYFIEDGINFPSVLSPAEQASVHALVEQTIHALGLSWGAAKGDIILHQGRPHLIEMASRTSGGWFGAGSIPLATGVRPLRPLLQMAMGDSPDLAALEPKRALACAQRYWIPQAPARFEAVDGVDKVEQMPGVEMFNAFFPAAGTTINKAQHHAQRYAQVICTAVDREQAMARADAAIASLQVRLSPIATSEAP